MGCPTIPLSCLDPSRIFAGVYNPACAGFADPSRFQAERAIFNSGFGELINNFGVDVGYYVNSFNLSAMNSIYGEHTLQTYYGPTDIKMYIQLEEPSPIYSLAGFDSSDTITAYVHIGTFTSVFSALSVFPTNGQSIEPKAQDKIKLYSLGCDRPNGRGAKIFEVTEVLDQDNSELNPMGGHYVWRIKGVRSEFNSETNEPRENVNNQVYDNTFAGKLSSVLFPSLTGEQKGYPQNADTLVQTQVFPPNTQSTSSYGSYY
jgi:hypothetical protein